jgi:hypothetical protein
MYVEEISEMSQGQYLRVQTARRAPQAQQTIDAERKFSERVISYSHQLFRKAPLSLVIKLQNNLLTRFMGATEAHTGSRPDDRYRLARNAGCQDPRTNCHMHRDHTDAQEPLKKKLNCLLQARTPSCASIMGKYNYLINRYTTTDMPK